MTTAELEQKILDYIESWYNATYTGDISVTRVDGVYAFSIDIPSWMCKTNIGGEFSSDDDFLNFVYQEIRQRNYMRVYFYKVERTEISREE